MSKQSFLGHLCGNRNSFSRTAGAGRTYRKLLFWENPFSEIINNKPQNDRLDLLYGVKITYLRACGVREAILFHDIISFITRQFQRAIAHPNRTTIIRERPDNTFIII